MDQGGYIKLDAVLTRIPVVFEKIEHITGGWFPSLASSLVGAAFGAFLGYYLAIRHQQKVDSIKNELEIFKETIKLKSEIIPILDQLTVQLSKYYHPKNGGFEKSFELLASSNDKIEILYANLVAFQKKKTRKSSMMLISWYAVLKYITENDNISSEEWLDECQNFIDTIEWFKGSFFDLEKSVSLKYFPEIKN